MLVLQVMINSNQKQISNHLLSEIKNALESVNYGSIEIIVQNKVVTQITVRNIHKTSTKIERDEQEIKVSSHASSVTSQHIETHAHIQKNSVKI